jgi:outer membrane biosynthesis protein TonB
MNCVIVWLKLLRNLTVSCTPLTTSLSPSISCAFSAAALGPGLGGLYLLSSHLWADWAWVAPAAARAGGHLAPYGQALLNQVARGSWLGLSLAFRLLLAGASLVGAGVETGLRRAQRWWLGGGRTSSLKLVRILVGVSQEQLQWLLTSACSSSSMALPAGARADGEAAAAAIAGGRLVAPCFRLIARANEWDEVFDLKQLPGRLERLALTTTDDGSAFKYIAYMPAMMMTRTPVTGVDQVPSRMAPIGVPGLSINWMCTPPDAGCLFEPTEGQVAALMDDAAVVEQRLVTVGLTPDRVAVLGAQVGTFPSALPEAPGLQVAVPAPAELPLGGGAPVAAALPAGPGAVAALGFPAGGLGAAAENMSLEDMRASIRAIRTDLKQANKTDKMKQGKRSKSKKKRDKKKKESKDKKAKKDRDRSNSKQKKKKKKKKRKGRSGGSSPSSSSSGSTSGSSSISTSSSDSDRGHYVRWLPHGSNRKIKVEELSRFATRKFRDQSEIISFAATHPGALTGFFLSMVHQRANQGLMAETKSLRTQSLVSWVANHAGLTEMRYRREALTLAMAMDAINGRQLAYAMDVLSQRIQSIQAAKAKGGSWDKAQRIELAVEPGAIASSSGMLRLTA